MKIVLKIADSKDYNMFMGIENSLYTVKLSKNYKYWYYEFCDMIGFYENSDVELIIKADKSDIELAKKLYGNHRFNETFLRENESKVLVHSTTIESAKSIISDGKIKSWNILKSEKSEWENQPIGVLLGDIADFSNYVMLSGCCQNNEIIIASKLKGEIDINENQKYSAGARFYIDGEKLACDGLLLRDGEHLKVKDCIPLDRYLIWYSTPERLNISAVTTPKKFFELSNNRFFELYTNYK